MAISPVEQEQASVMVTDQLERMTLRSSISKTLWWCKKLNAAWRAIMLPIDSIAGVGTAQVCGQLFL